MEIARVAITAEEYERRPDPGHPEELVRGKVVAGRYPGLRHGFVCNRAVCILGNFVEGADFGRVLCGNAAVITGRDPDTVRGPDLSIYSFDRLPRGTLARGYGPEIPEIVVEVLSEDDTWREMYEKLSDYLIGGVLMVIVLDPSRTTAHVFGADEPPVSLEADDELNIPGILEGFSVRVAEFFE